MAIRFNLVREISKTIEDFVTAMSQGEIIHEFEGEITEPLVNEMLTSVESRLESEEEDAKKGRKVYNVLVEALQNLYHHTDAYTEEILDNGEHKKTALFIVAKKDEEYNILAANYIVKDSIPSLRSRLDRINELDKDGLRDYYREVLDNGQYSIHGGGGLGMIDIARKSGNKLNYEFANVNHDYGLFILKIKI